MYSLANPQRFMSLSAKALPFFAVAAATLIAIGLYMGFTAPPDFRQGETVRIMYIHVPAAWLGMGGWSGIAISSIMALVWRHPLATIAARAIALPGAVFAALCLTTGSIWGRPTWGTWWEWDGRLTSMLLLFAPFSELA